MARQSAHKNPLSDKTKVAVAKTLIKLAESSGWKPVRIGKNLEEFYLKYSSVAAFGDPELLHADFYPNPATIKTVLAEVRIPSDGTAKALYHWLKTDYESVLRDVTIEEGEPFVKYCRTAFGHSLGAKPERMAEYSGRFKLYRPFHLDPLNTIAVELLTIGDEESPFDCTLLCQYDVDGVREGAFSVGKAVPHGSRVFMLMQVGKDRNSNIILFFDRSERDSQQTAENKEPPVVGLAGCMLAAVGTFDPASAWPCYAQRLRDNDPFEPHLLAKSDLMTIPTRARHALARGAIYWNHDHYPFPFGK